MEHSDMRRRHSGWWLALVLAVAGGAMAAPEAGAQTLEMTLIPAAITFPSADPDASPSILSQTVEIRYRVRGGSGTWAITLQAGSDLTDGEAVIPVTGVTWTATPTDRFHNGTMSRTVAQTLATGITSSSGFRRGYVTFSLANSWSYNVGTYSASFIFTLVAQ